MKIAHDAMSILDALLTFIALTAIAGLVMYGPEFTNWLMGVT